MRKLRRPGAWVAVRTETRPDLTDVNAVRLSVCLVRTSDEREYGRTLEMLRAAIIGMIAYVDGHEDGGSIGTEL